MKNILYYSANIDYLVFSIPLAACNRTYYGLVGATYVLQVGRPGRGSLPFFCQLTFIASGDVYGDLVQLNIEEFNLGR